MSETRAVAGCGAHRIVRPGRLRRVGRVIATGFLAAAAGGLLASIPARLLMRVVAIGVGESPHFSWTGSIGIAVIFGFAVLPGAWVAASTTRRGRWLTLAAGAVLLCIPATGVASAEVGSTSGYSLARWFEVGSAGAGVYACIAALPFITLRLVDGRIPGRAGQVRRTVANRC
jgi:hypothetical protein